MRRREIILAELGLTPLWLHRDRLAVHNAAESQAHATSYSETPESRATRGALPSPVRATPGSAPRSEPRSPSRKARSVGNMDWVELREAASACSACVLHEKRKQAVLGVGDEQADWLFVGEAPGAEEDERGEPFVGQAGKLLDNMLSAIGLNRGNKVYIANVVKCRPPGNRNPTSEETQACEPFLDRQIALLQPRLIVALGKVAANTLLGGDATLGSLRNTVHEYRGIPLIVTYHPAYLLRTLTDKSKAWEDLCFAVDTMSGLPTVARDVD